MTSFITFISSYKKGDTQIQSLWPNNVLINKKYTLIFCNVNYLIFVASMFPLRHSSKKETSGTRNLWKTQGLKCIAYMDVIVSDTRSHSRSRTASAMSCLWAGKRPTIRRLGLITSTMSIVSISYVKMYILLCPYKIFTPIQSTHILRKIFLMVYKLKSIMQEQFSNLGLMASFTLLIDN